MIPEFNFLYEYVDHYALSHPQFPAVNFNDRVTSSLTLSDHSKKIASGLIKQGIMKGDRIVTILPASIEYTLLMIAANRIGVCIAPMDMKYRRTDFKRLIPDLDPSLIIAVKETDNFSYKDAIEELDLSCPIIYVEDDFSKLIDNDMVESRNSEIDQDFMIIWTGGTTGLPKAAVLTNRNVTRMCYLEGVYLESTLQLRGLTETPRYLANLPVNHVGGSVEMIGVGIVAGYELYFHERWSATRTLQAIQKRRITHMLAAPTMYRIMMLHEDYEKFDLSSIKVALISGEVVNQEFIDLFSSKFCDTIINGYGSTEMGPELTFTNPDEDYSLIARGYVGKPLPGMEIKIADGENFLEIGEVGEVLVRGELVCKGYFNNPEEDEKAFFNGWFRTGDLGKLDDRGGLWLVGRLKDIIRVGTYTVLPMEIEELVLKSFDLELAAAISVPDKILGEVVCLVIAEKPGNEINDEEIIKLCKQELASYRVPRKIIHYKIDPADPPITRIGKIDRCRIRAEILST